MPTDRPTSSGPGPQDWRTSPAGVLTATTVVHMLSAMGMFALSSLGPSITSALGLDAATIGYIAGAAFASAGLSAVGIGVALARYGAATIVQVGLFVVSLGAVAASGGSALALAVGVCIVGIGYGVIGPGSSVVLSQFCSPARRNFDFSIKQAATPAGTAVAGSLAPLIAARFGWPSVFAGIAVIAALIGLSFFWLRDVWDVAREPSDPRSSPWTGLRTILSEPSLARLALMSFLFSCAQVGTGAYLTLYFVEHLGYPIALAGALLSTTSIAGLFGRFIVGYVADRASGSIRVLFHTGVGAGVTIGILAAATPGWPQWAVFLLVALFGVAGYSWVGPYQAAVADSADPLRVREVIAGSFGPMFLGAVSGPMIAAAVLAVSSSYPLVFVSLGLTAAAAAACIAGPAFREA